MVLLRASPRISSEEIAFGHGISYFTIRNAFSSVYVKLRLSGSAEFFALGAYYRIE